MKNLAKVSAILITVLTVASCSNTKVVAPLERSVKTVKVVKASEEVESKYVVLKIKDSDVFTIIPKAIK